MDNSYLIEQIEAMAMGIISGRTIIVSSGALPYDDASGHQVEIDIEAREGCPDRVNLNYDSDFCSFDVEDWPKVRAAIDRAVHARDLLRAPKTKEEMRWTQTWSA